MYAILGTTGKVGSIVADNLLKKNLPVTAIVRDHAKGETWKNKGAVVAIADLKNTDALSSAFNNTEGVFIMTPPLWDSNDPMGENGQMLQALVKAIDKAQPRKIVYLSSVGGQLEYGTGAIRKLYDLEQAMNTLNIPTIGIRAAWFMDNFIGSINHAKDSGELPSFLERTSEAIPMVATVDIGALAANLLQETWPGHLIIELQGPERYSPNDVAAVLSKGFNKEIVANAIADQDFEATYLSFGFTPEGSLGMSAMIRGFNAGTLIFEEQGIEQVKGNTSLEQVLHHYLN